MPKKLSDEERAEKAREWKKISRKRYYGKTANLYPRRSWSNEEIQMVLEHSVPDSELSVTIKRSVKSIQEERRRLKKEQN